MSPWGAPPGEAIPKSISWSPTMEMGDARRVHVQQTALCMIISCQKAPSPLGFKPHHPLERCKGGIKSLIIFPQEWPPSSTGAGSGDTAMQRHPRGCILFQGKSLSLSLDRCRAQQHPWSFSSREGAFGAGEDGEARSRAAGTALSSSAGDL